MPVSRSDLEKMALGDFRGQPSCIGSRMAEELICLQDDHAKLINAFNRTLLKLVEMTGIVCEYDNAEFLPGLFRSLLGIPDEKGAEEIRKHFSLPEGFQFYTAGQDPEKVNFHPLMLIACKNQTKDQQE